MGCAVYNSIVALNELEDFDPKVVEFLENRETKKQKNVTQLETSAPIGPPTCATSDPKEKIFFLGIEDRKTVHRPQSQAPKFSEAAKINVEARELKKGLPVGASLPLIEREKIALLRGKKFPPAKIRDIRTTRMRHQNFIDLIGDHPIDTYNRDDFIALIDHLRFMLPNVSKRASASGKDTRSSFIENWDPETSSPRKPSLNTKTGKLQKVQMSRQTIKNGFIGCILPVFRSNEWNGRSCDPIAGKPLEYPPCFTKSHSAEPISDQKMSLIVKSGLKVDAFQSGCYLCWAS